MPLAECRQQFRRRIAVGRQSILLLHGLDRLARLQPDLAIDFADVVFAVDSIPAIFAVTQDPFLVFSSNAFAILGLRSLYFAIAGMMAMFHYLKISLVFILGFIGIKLMLVHHYKIPDGISLSVIVGMLVIGVVASILTKSKHKP